MKKLKYISLGYIASVLWMFIAQEIISYMGYPYEYGEILQVTPQWTFFYVCIFAPLWEEALYRYAPITIAKNLGKQYILPVIVASSLIFGWQHYQNPESVLLQGGVGFVLCYTYIKAGYSYFSSVLVHSFYNLSMIFLENWI